MTITSERIDRVEALYRKLIAAASGHSNGDIVAAAVHLVATLIATADDENLADRMLERACLVLVASVTTQRANKSPEGIH